MDNKLFSKPEQLNLFGETEQESIEKSLFDRFIIPPFSIFDSRQGYWQNRKKVWLSIGIKSEIGRDSKCYHIKDWADKKRETGELSGSKLPSDVSVFDPVVCEIAYKWFNIQGGVIIDPFAGGSVRGVVAKKLGFDYVGFDLRQEQVDANYENAKELNVDPKWICDDSTNLDKYIANESADMIFTCPPYYDLEIYSDDPNDLSTMEYEQFDIAYQKIIEKCAKALKPNRFAVFVVGDVRDKDGFMVSLRATTIKCFEKVGMRLYNDIVLATSLASASIRAGTPMSVNRKITKVHQYILVFYKGDTKTIKDNYKELDLDY